MPPNPAPGPRRGTRPTYVGRVPPKADPPVTNSMAGALEAALRRRVEGDVDFGAGARALYATDASNYRQTPIGVVVPRTIEDVIDTVRICSEYRAPILPRGAGTSLA